MAKGRFHKLEQVLLNELDALKALCAASQRQNEALVRNDRETFLATVREQDQTVARMSELEITRARVVSLMAVDLCVPPSASLLQLSRSLPEVERRRALEIHQELSRVAVSVSELNRANEALVRQALEHTQHAISVLVGQAAGHQDSLTRTHGARAGGLCMGLLNARA